MHRFLPPYLKWFCMICFTLGTLLLMRQAVHADIISVTTTNDSGDGSLRQAIIAANVNDTVHFDASLGGQTITLTSTLMIDKELTIDGSTLTTTLAIDGDNATQLFSIGAGTTVTLTQLTLANANGSFGGAIFNRGNLTVDSVTFHNNNALQGGGIYNVGLLMVENSTFHGNSSFNGGAISNLDVLTMTNSTLVANSSNNPGGGIANADKLYLYNTIIAGSTSGGDCVNEEIDQLDILGTLEANVNNFIEDSSCEAALSGDPKLESLAVVDGVLVHLPMAESGAIDAGDNATCTTTDQRNLSRPQGTACDIGAVELAAEIDLSRSVTETTFAAIYTSAPQPCGDSILPRHTVTPTFRNESMANYTNLYVKVTELDYQTAQAGQLPILCNADGGPGGVDAQLTLTDTLFGPNGTLDPSETFTQSLQIGLPIRAGYRIGVELYGVTEAQTRTTRDEQLLGRFTWVFDLNALTRLKHRLYLPVVER